MTTPTSYPEALAAAGAARATAQTVSPNRIVATTAEGVITVRERAAAAAKRALRALWASVNPYDPKQVDDFAAKGVKVLASAQTATGRAAAAAVVTQLKALDIKVDALPSIPADVRAPAVIVVGGKVTLEHHDHTVEYANGDTHTVTAEEMTTEAVLKRPAAGFRWIQSEEGLDAAEQSGLRIDQIVDDNLMLAQRLAETQVLAKAVDLDAEKSTVRVIGYRRVIHPELSRSGTCGLCIAASDRIYKVGELRPVHANCKCTVAPVTEDHDPADELNNVDLQALYDAGGGTSQAHLKRTRYKVDEHGELGAVLVPKRPYKPRDKTKQATGDARAAGAHESPTDTAARHIPQLQKSLADLRARGLAEDSPQVTYHKKQIERFQTTLADAGDTGPTRETSVSRRKNGVNETTTPEAAAGRSGNEPPAQPPIPPRGGNPRPGDDWSDEERSRRQHALGIDTHGEQLHQHEIEFIEKFHAAGQHLEWIPRAGFTPTNDFVWTNNDNLLVELKSTSARYRTIHGRIVDAASRAAKHSVVKDNFMIDIGEEPLTDGLREQVSQFNVGRRKYRLSRLWVMSQGVITEIDLAE